MNGADALIPLLVGGGLGFVVGLERQLSPHGEDGYAGARTFALYGAWGAAAGFLGYLMGAVALTGALISFVALLLTFYVSSSRETGDWGTTTETAALLVFFAGVLAWERQWVAAVGLTVAVTALLRAKKSLHGLADRFSDEDVRAFVQFAVVTAVILPLVPDEAMGSFGGFNPREVWLMVVFVSAIGLVGYVALRLFGSRGLPVAGLLGGLVSSTAVTLSFSRMARTSSVHPALVAGVLGACALMYPRVLIEALVIAPALATRLALWLLAAFMLAVAGALIYWSRSRSAGTAERSEVEVRNPLTLSVALGFGALYAVVAFASRGAVEYLSPESLPALGALTGLNDVDAITLSMANLVQGGLSVDPAASAVLAAVTTNVAVKVGLAWAVGGKAFGRAVGAILAASGLVTAAGWLLL